MFGPRCEPSRWLEAVLIPHEDGLQPSRLSPHRVSEHGTLTPCCALTVRRSKLVGPEVWQNAAGGRPIGHVCRLRYLYGWLRRFGGSPATLGAQLHWQFGAVIVAGWALRHLREEPQ